MGYRSNVYLKTTTEGWILMKKMNDSIKIPEDKPLAYATVERTESGFYKITFEDLKWYDTYNQVKNFNLVLDQYEDQDIPYSFIRLGEDTEDIVHKRNYPDDMPSEIETFEPVVDVNDEEWGAYEEVMSDGKEVITESKPIDDPAKADEKMRPIMFDLFDEYKYADDIIEALRSLHSSGEITEFEYDRAQENYNKWLAEWEEDRMM